MNDLPEDPHLHAEVKQALTQPEISPAERRLAAEIERTMHVARNAGRRLFEARPPDMPRPQTREEMIACIESMMRTPGKFGVMLMPWEVKALRRWNKFVRKLWANEDKPGPVAS